MTSLRVLAAAIILAFLVIASSEGRLQSSRRRLPLSRRRLPLSRRRLPLLRRRLPLSRRRLPLSGRRYGGDKKDAEKPLNASDPNVCSFQKSVPSYWCRWKCGQVTAYKCCVGFKRVPGKAGCPKEIYTSALNIAEVAKELGLSKFLKYAGRVSVAKLLTGKTKFTLFAPTDEAFEKMPQKTLEKMKSLKWARYFVQYHVVEGKHIAENLKDGMKLSSYEFHDPLRVTVLRSGGKTILIEGANVSKPNQGASNGVIHVIDQVLTPPRHTIMELLKRDGSRRFTIMHQILTTVALNMTGQYTLFAPTDKAFEKIPKETLRKLLSNNSRCLETLVKHHFIRGYLFSKTIRPSQSRIVPTLEKSNQLCMKRNDSSEMTVDDKRVSEKDVLATDGVVHVIDEVLLVNTALDLVSLSEHLNLTEFSKLLKRSNLTVELEGQGPYTIFAPNNEAFQDLTADVKQSLAQNPQLLKTILEHHVVKGSVLWSQMRNNMMLTTLSIGNKLRVKTSTYISWRTVKSVEGSCMKRTDIPACNGVIHIMDKVLVPTPADNLLQTLDRKPRLSLFRSQMMNTSVEALLGNDNNSFTIFAPSNDAILAAMSDNKTKGIFNDTQAFIKRHIIRGMEHSKLLTCARRGTYWFNKSSCRTEYRHNMVGDKISLRRCPNDDFKINGIKANTTDISAINGVIHVIDGVILKKRVPIATWGWYTPSYPRWSSNRRPWGYRHPSG